MLLQKFKQQLSAGFPGAITANKKWLIAVSGGLDSVVLCDLAHKTGIDFIIAHCNFQLRGEESERDEAFVKSLGANYSKQVCSTRFNTHEFAQQHKQSTQVAARELRYQWFREIINGAWTIKDEKVKELSGNDIHSGDVTTDTPRLIVTAHHANDNIETLLINFFKGTGIAGLHGILPLHNQVFRPLLPFKKEELAAYAAEQNLLYVEDSSNQQDKYTRNYFRHHLMPVLKEKFPAIEDNLLNNINRFSEAEILYQQAVAQHKKKLLESNGNEVMIPVLKLKKVEPLRSVLFEIIKEYGFLSSQLDDALQLLESDSGKYIASPAYRLIRNRKWLIIAPCVSTEASNVLIEEGDQWVQFEGGAIKIEHLQVKSDMPIPTSSLMACVNSNDISFPLILRKWKQGDYFYPLGMKKKKKLSRFFIDKKLSKSDKEKVWVIEMNKKIVWVVGQRIDERFKLEPSTTSMIQFTFSK